MFSAGSEDFLVPDILPVLSAPCGGHHRKVMGFGTFSDEVHVL
jgi:hypothetical protein